MNSFRWANFWRTGVLRGVKRLSRASELRRAHGRRSLGLSSAMAMWTQARPNRSRLASARTITESRKGRPVIQEPQVRDARAWRCGVSQFKARRGGRSKKLLKKKNQHAARPIRNAIALGLPVARLSIGRTSLQRGVVSYRTLQTSFVSGISAGVLACLRPGKLSFFNSEEVPFSCDATTKNRRFLVTPLLITYRTSIISLKKTNKTMRYAIVSESAPTHPRFEK